MLKSKKTNSLLVILVISMVMIPIMSIQRDNEFSINEKVSNEIINTQTPHESSVYYQQTTGKAHGIYVSGDYAYIANSGSGLAVIDISDPTDPGMPFYTPYLAGPVMDVYVSGDYAYVGRQFYGLGVIDISDPTVPVWSGTESTNGFSFGVYVSGDYAYLANSDEGLAVIDISDPTNPGTPVYENTTGIARNVYVSGDYAYVADDYSGLAVIDISDPTNPGTPVYEDTTGDAIAVYVSGDYAYVADGYSGLAVIDISDPTNPGTPVYEDTTGKAIDVYVRGDYVYVGAYGSGLAVIDISDPTNPGPPIYEYTSGGAYNVYVSGAYAYVTDYNEGLAVVAISEPIYEGTPVYKDTTGWALGVHVSGNYAYVADFEGLAVIDISDPTNPGTPVYENTTGSALDVYVSGDYAYVADFNEGLAVINISDPTNPGTPVYENTTGKARGVYVSGNYAYVADDISGLAIIDISDPTNPGTPVYENTNGFAFDVYVSGNYAYVANGNEGLVVINISDPTSPGTPVYENTTGSAYDVYVSGDYAYVADFNKGLAVINISNPTNPGTPVYENTTGQASGVYVSGDYAYIADGDGLEVINISDPTDPETLFYRDMVNNLGYVYVNGDYAYMSCGGTGLGIIQVRMRMEAPIILNTPNDLALGFGYTGQSLSWIATDPNPSNYTIELQGLGIVAGSTNWTSGVAITYNIPDGFSVGSYTYIVNFTDDYGNSITDSVTFTVFEVINPTITSAPSDLTVVHGYTGKVFSWTATDANPSNYTIELQGLGIVAGSTNWTSGVAITYNIPNGFSLGSYTYTVNFTDDYGNSITDNVTFTVAENDPPNVINSPYSLTTALGYTGQSLSWIATDANPSNYTIELQGLGIVAGSTNWTSGVAITYNIPDGFSVGSYTYIVNFTDDYGNSITDSVTFTVFEEMTRPVITSVPIDLTLEFGYTGQSLSWTATDANPDTYTIELLGSSIVVGPTSWTSGTAITYNIPNGFIVGDYEYKITFIDESGNSISDRVRVRVDPVSDDGGDNGDAPPEGTVPLGNYFLIFIVLSVIYLIFTKKRQTNRESR